MTFNDVVSEGEVGEERSKTLRLPLLQIVSESQAWTADVRAELAPSNGSEDRSTKGGRKLSRRDRIKR